MHITRRTIGKYAGPIVYGEKNLIEKPDASSHLERAFWLTCEVETGNRMGSVMMADGTAFTIGLDQHVAVYPKELAHEDFNALDDQGGAWALLAEIEKAHGPVEPLWEALKEQGWYVSPDGHLRWLEEGRAKIKGKWVAFKAGDLVHGALIRDVFTPYKGYVEKTKINTKQWEQSKRWATLLHELTAHPQTFEAQKQFGINHLIERIKTRKIKFSTTRRKTTNFHVIYQTKDLNEFSTKDLGENLDLAMCVFHAYTVNAPAIAYSVMAKTFLKTHRTHSKYEFSKELLSGLKNQKYGRWDKRWIRTRKIAMDSGLWDPALFKSKDAIMPLN